MILWEIIDKLIQNEIKWHFKNALDVILIIIFDGIYAVLKAFFFPSGNLTIEIIIILGNIHAIFRMGHFVIMDILEMVYESNNEIKKLKTQSRKML